METKAHHLVIGAIALALLGALLTAVYWIENRGTAGLAPRQYAILFTGPVTGLSRATEVLFNGIPVGKIRDLAIDPEDTRKVRVTIAISPNAPVRTDSRARIVRKGLANQAAILITAGSPGRAFLRPDDGRKVALIAAEAGAPQSLFEAAPRAMERARIAFDRLNALLAENQEAVGRATRNIEVFSRALAESEADYRMLVHDTASLAGELRSVTAKLDSVLEKMDGLLGPENAGALVAEARAAASEFHSLARRLDDTFGAQAGNLTRTAKRSLNEFEQFMKEGRRAVRKLESVLRNIERNPSSLIFGGSAKSEDGGTN